MENAAPQRIPDAGPAPFRRRAAALMLACHPAPAAGVTLIAGLLAVAAGASAGTAVRVGAAVAAGQLSIGWSNDALDAGRDVTAGRRDKPVAQGRVSRRAVAAAAAVAAVVTVPLSLALGVVAGVVHLVCVASAWSYNLRLKSTVWSWAPFALSFGLLPAVATLAAEGVWPAPWVLGAGALLGTGAHVVNVLPDVEEDAAAGVRGAVHRFGRARSAALAPALLLAAVVLAVVARPGPLGVVGWTTLGPAVVLAGLAVAAGARGRRVPAIAATAGIAVLVVTSMVVAGTGL